MARQVIYYRPIERHWYRIADVVQHGVQQVTNLPGVRDLTRNRIGATTVPDPVAVPVTHRRERRQPVPVQPRRRHRPVWFLFYWLVLMPVRFTLIVAVKVAGAVVIVGGGVLYIMLSTVLGNGGLAEGVARGQRKH
jgi:hypothetical protein